MKDLKYIIKRVIIGTLIAILVYLIKGNLLLNVNAAVISHQSTSINTTFTNINADYTYTVSDNPFNRRGPGTVNFSVAMYKVNGAATDPIVMIRNVNLYNATGYFSCNVGSTSLTNSTFGGTVYSISCPVDLTEGGISSVRFYFMDYQSNNVSTYRFQFNGLFTYVGNQDINLDTSGTTNAINNQITNDNTNTDKIVDAQEETTQAIEDNTQAVNDVNDTLKDDNVTGATNEGSSFFSDFQSNSHGLTGIISSPLRLLNSLSSSTCSPLSFTLPFVHNTVNLPCMSTIYENYFSSFLSIYRIITTGIIGYWVMVKIFSHVKNMQSPENDKIEVFDL